LPDIITNFKPEIPLLQVPGNIVIELQLPQIIIGGDGKHSMIQKMMEQAEMWNTYLRDRLSPLRATNAI
jgi:hypothetical protein